MTITVADLQFNQSQRMTQTADGGGRMTANVIQFDGENQIFTDITDQDRAVGEFAVAKIYAALKSANTDPYLDAGVVVFKRPADPTMSVLAFSTGSHYDERRDLIAKLEQTISRGPRYAGWLYGQHLQGQRALLIWQRIEASFPAAGTRLEVVAKAGSVEQSSEFVWITRVTDEIRTMYEAQSGQSTIQYQVRVVTCELAEPLTADYLGAEPSRADPSAVTATALLYETRYNPESVPLYGIQPLIDAGAVNDLSFRVSSLYESLIPTSFTETALTDVSPSGDAVTLVPGHSGTVSFTTNVNCIGPDKSLFVGSPVYPGTLSIAVSGATLTDSNGNVLLAGTVIGALDYSNGVTHWNSACPSYGAASKIITFRPAANPIRTTYTAAVAVTAENRGYVWALTHKPIPAPGTLRVAYRANKEWYVINDKGTGVLKGADSSYGSGQVSFSTGTSTISTGALPDVGSLIIYTWSVPVGTTARGGNAVDPLVVRFQTANKGIKPVGATISWTVGATTCTLTDSAGTGTFSGADGSGVIDYVTGAGWVRPTLLLPKGTEFSISYQYGTVGSPSEIKTATVTATVSGSNYTLTLPDTNIQPGSLGVEYTVVIKPPHQVYDYTVSDKDNGSGTFAHLGGTINNTAGTATFAALQPVSAQVQQYVDEPMGTNADGSTVYRWVVTGFATQTITPEYVTGTLPGSFKVSYRLSGTANWTAATETFTVDQIELDLTKGFQETITTGSVRFLVGSNLYAETAGQLYLNPSPDTGAGTLAGTIDRSSGRCYISDWAAGGANAVTLQSLTTEIGGHPVDEVVWRTPASPIKSGTLQVRYVEAGTGIARSKTVTGTGVLEDADAKITMDHEQGIGRAQFGRWRADSELTPAEKTESWYNPAHRVDFAGVLKIWQPRMVLADSILYNAVAMSFLPPDSALLGINAARLPPDGKALIFAVGRMVLIHNSQTLVQTNLSPTQVIDVGRVRLYRVSIADSTGKRLAASQYDLDRALGKVTLSPTLDLTGYTGPYSIDHTVADLARIIDTDISGIIKINLALSHAYPANTSYCSGVLPAGTMQARITNIFSQAAWTNVWSDTRIGDPILAQYNDAAWPLIVSNLGAQPDRYLIQFTSATAYRCIGEHQGVIGIGDINTDFAPVNTLTNQVIFTIRHQGWGSGWATGNCLRFEIVSANYPVDLIRATQPSQPTGSGLDHFEMLFVGNVDA